MTTAVFLAPLSVAGGPFFIPGGNQPAAGGQLFSYITGSSTKLATYTTSSGAVANSNPIVLDSGGFVTGSGEVWLIQSSTYRFILAPSTDTDPPASPYWTRDSISGINDVQTQINAAGQEWILASTTPVFANASSFVVGGDQRQTFAAGRRVKTTNTGGTVYGTITSAAISSGSTTVFAVPDSGGFDSGLSAVSYGIISTPNGSVPWSNVSTGAINISSASFKFVSTNALTVGATTTIFGLVVARKTSNTTTNVTSFTSDTDLQFPIGANEEWIVDYVLDLVDNQASTATGERINISSPAGATTKINAMVVTSTGAVGSSTFIQRANSGGPFSFLWANGGSTDVQTRIHYWIVNGANSGSVILQHAVVASNPSTLTVEQGSLMTAYRKA